LRSEDLLSYIGNVDDRYVEELFAESDTAVTSIKKVTKRRRFLAVAASLAIIILGTGIMMNLGFGMHSGQIYAKDRNEQIPMAQNTVLMLDVNPSIRLEIDDRDNVVAVSALNDDAKELTTDAELVGQNYKEAVTDILKLMHKDKYLTELKNSVLVTVFDPSETVAESYKAATVEVVKAYGESVNCELSILSQLLTDDSEYIEMAQEKHISTGRVALIDKICEESGETVDKFIDYNVQVLNQVLDYIGVPVGVERTGSVAGVIDDMTRSTLGIASMTVDEIIGFSYSIYDFLDDLSEYYDESDIVRQNGYELQVKQEVSNQSSPTWSISARDTAGASDKLTQGTVYSYEYTLGDGLLGVTKGIGGLFELFDSDTGNNDTESSSVETASTLPGVTIRFRASCGS